MTSGNLAPRPDAQNPADLASKAQFEAADPRRSVWVAASAGSGKTKVLTERVLRLLLPGADGLPGTPPEKLLCLTFTKAGAAEMAVRINEKLAEWAVWPEEKLHRSLHGLLGRAPLPQESEAARRLFARVIDTAGGLKIMTIHSFCQSVLGRFPLEAGLPPHFTLVEERAAQDIQIEAFTHVLERAQALGVQDAIDNLSAQQGEAQIFDLLKSLLRERLRLQALLRREGGVYAEICARMRIDPDLRAEDIVTAMVTGMDEAALRRAAKAMAQDKGKTMTARLPVLCAMLDAAEEERPALLQDYCGVFLKKSPKQGEDPVFATLLTKPAREFDPDAEEIMRAEAERLLTLEDRLKAVRNAGLTHDLLRLAGAVLAEYDAAKGRLAALDYDDLIARTLALLRGETANMAARDFAPWVMFKLDQGIDHVLVDEAQDTNPDQWDIIHALCAPFFEGIGGRDDVCRTVFAVGDEKQSIFGFQRAAPEKFRAAGALYAAKSAAAKKDFKSIPLNVSFRSTEAVLNLTDAVFDAVEPWKAMGLPEGTRVQHQSSRTGQAGLVELWPLIDPPAPPEPGPWELPVEVAAAENAEARLAQRIAGTIHGWLDKGERLEAYDRLLRPGDIMILVRYRGTLVEHLVRALKAAAIPVSGIDRMRLGEQIAVQDLLAAAQFALLPEDSLTLACLLKSPLLGLTEERLYEVAIDRGNQSLWAAAKTRLKPEESAWLSALIAAGGRLHPYEFFSFLLQSPCPADPGGSGFRAMMARLGEDCRDPLEEFLNTTLQYETANTPSLQQFLHWQAAGNSEIKREMEGAGDKIRIMTVHGSKGLQAPVVILPDTVHTAASITKTLGPERILWPAGADFAAPLWSPRGEDDSLIYGYALQERKQKLAEEYNRLLYVALTRAADRLYVAGCVKGPRNKPAGECWYNMVARAFAHLPHESFVQHEGDTLPALRLHTAQTAPPDRVQREKETSAILPACADWSWLEKSPAPEETPPRPLTPSRPSEPEPALRSPRDSGADNSRFQRGNITHTLLQFLPGLPQDTWEHAARQFTARQDFSDSVKDGIVAETLAILRHPDFAALFGPGSMAEVPVTARLTGGPGGDRLVSGQIDRLLVTEKDILIVDYKTNRPPPADPKDIPAIYRSQLRAYRDTLEKIYPGRAIRTFLLWTDGPRMVEIFV